MPIYGYRCDQCGHELEVLQSMRDEPLRVCPNCMGPLRKLVYAAGIIFKGSGYYTTDYKDAGKGSRDGDGKSSSSAESVKPAESKSDSKSESQSESKSYSKPAKESASKPADTAKPAS